MSRRKILITSAIVIMSIFSIFSLSSFFNKKNEDIYLYGTESFNQKSNEMRYTLNDAIDIFCDYMFEDKNIDNIGFHAEIIYGEDYVFTDKAYKTKTGQYFIAGYLVNGETGQIKTIERKTICKCYYDHKR